MIQWRSCTPCWRRSSKLLRKAPRNQRKPLLWISAFTLLQCHPHPPPPQPLFERDWTPQPLESSNSNHVHMGIDNKSYVIKTDLNVCKIQQCWLWILLFFFFFVFYKGNFKAFSILLFCWLSSISIYMLLLRKCSLVSLLYEFKYSLLCTAFHGWVCFALDCVSDKP